ncbi:MAG: Rne/Rng family ribonuclease [Notoacmeibacter sp.]
MSSKMLIDASHPEETRVVVVRGNRIEEFDYESAHRKQLRGNIYLARVTRVEPSLQAAFVEYGGNRHGFLAFGEIHPDYYQIPVADRQALLEEHEFAARSEEDEEDEAEQKKRGKPRRGKKSSDRPRSANPSDENRDGETAELAASIEGGDVISEAFQANDGEALDDISEDGAGEDDGTHDNQSDEEISHEDQQDDAQRDADASEIESVGEEDALEEVPVRRHTSRKQYKIQEVIKRRQILLVQIVKEERGNKGAALTTYMSLAGRYSVLMPNTARGGGISRKITSITDRKRLRSIVDELEVPKGMGVILRTAGANRTKPEVKRDYEYLMRLWDNVRDKTLASSAPCLVYEEGSLIKRSIRDLYGKEIDEVQVSGEEGYREAKDFMRMLMPSHAKAVQPYRDPLPIFSRNGIDSQLDKMLQPHVSLKSGGYIIINQTEALVSVDVNSGRSTKESSIESTALQTNLEAAEEVARQLRLRDLAGLIVIDFIDMMENRNNRAVEKRLKDCLKNDRARIQVGRISHFGLMEMSRQRIRASVLESTMQPCPHCTGTGLVRSDSSHALQSLRMIEEALLKDARTDLIVRLSPAKAMILLNKHRKSLFELEARFGVTINVESDAALTEHSAHITRGGPATPVVPSDFLKGITPPVYVEDNDPDIIDIEEDEEETAEIESSGEDDEDDVADASEARNGDGNGKKRRRKRRRGGNRDDVKAEGEGAEGESKKADENPRAPRQDGNDPKRKRRRGRRSGRRFRNDFEFRRYVPNAEPVGFSMDELDAFKAQDAAAEALADAEDAADEAAENATAESTAVSEAVAQVVPEITPTENLEPEPKKEAAPVAEVLVVKEANEAVEEPAKPRRIRATAETISSEPKTVTIVSNGSEGDTAEQKPKSGWWKRTGFF